MGWGGPRFEFYTANQYSNFTASIQREDAARVRSILQRNTSQQQKSLLQSMSPQDGVAQGEAKALGDLYFSRTTKERVHQQNESLHKDGIQQYKSPGHMKNKVSQKDEISCLQQLAYPKKHFEAASVGHMYGQHMYQRGNVVKFSVGHNGECYSPGVDRDRIVPERPSPDVMRPWIGSFSSHIINSKGKWRKTQVAQEVRCTKRASLYTRMKHPERASILYEIAAAHPEESSYENKQDSNQYGEIAIESLEPIEQLKEEGDAEDVSSVFSHALSNAPISNTGAKHLVSSSSTKEQVLEHLKACKYPKPTKHTNRAAPTSCTLNYMKEWPLPQLTYHVLMLQRECMQKCKERAI